MRFLDWYKLGSDEESGESEVYTGGSAGLVLYVEQIYMPGR